MAVRKKRAGQSEGSVNKSLAIREYKAKHKKARPKAIAEALREQGLDVDNQYVSMVLSNAKKKKKGKRQVAAAVNGIHQALAMPKNAFAIDELRLAKQLVDKVGSLPRAQQVLAAYKLLVH